MQGRKVLWVTFLILLNLVTTGCYGPRQQGGMNAQADLIVYFVANATNDDINRVWNETLSEPSLDGNGWMFKPGIGSIETTSSFEEHAAIAVNFDSNASQLERDTIKELLLASPLVYRVLEDAVPSQVESLDP